MNEEQKLGAGAGLFILAVVAFFIMLFGSMGTVRSGEIGVRTRFGAFTGETVQPGFYFKMPIFSGVEKIDIQIQKEDAEAEAASKNLQTVNSKISVNYRLSPESAVKVYTQIGKGYADQYIRPAIQEVVKATTAQYTADELISKRPEVSEIMRRSLIEKMQPVGIEIVAINITNFDFSPIFNQSIEAKAKAEQDALAAKNKLDQVKYESQQAVEQAKGKSEALKIEGEALRANPEVVQLRALEKWHGEVPLYWGGGALPFINVK
jgi:regulator of protease activity HflC (stomatin/prohibitin superfamily)